MLELLLEETNNKLVALRVTGHLSRKDYDRILPVLEDKIERYGKINVFVEVLEFPDFTLQALWEEIKFDVEHATDFDKVAIVGEGKWLDVLTLTAKPFTSAHIRKFKPSQRQEAMSWVAS